MITAMSAFSSTFGLVIVFFVAFPILAHALIGFALVQTKTEYEENQALLDGTDTDEPTVRI